MGKVLTIEIGNDLIKLAEVTYSKNSFVVHKAITVNTPDMAVHDGHVRNLAKVEQALFEAFSQNDIHTKDVIFTITPGRVMSREVAVPYLKDRTKVLSMIRANASEYFPVDTSDCVYAYTVLDVIAADKKNKQMKLMAYAVPDEIVQSLYDLAKLLKLRVVAVDYIANGVLQIERKHVGEKTTMVIQMNDENTVINIFSQSKIIMQRTVNNGVGELIRNVAEHYGIKFNEAMERLEQLDLITDDLIGVVPDELYQLLSSINRIREYYRNKFPNQPLEVIEVIGIAADFKGLGTLMEDRIGMSVDMESRFANIDNRTAVSSIMSYLDVFGAAINPINVAPKQLEENNRKKLRSSAFRTVILGSVLVGLLILVPQILSYMNSMLKNQQMHNNLKQLSNIDQIVIDYNDASKKYEDIRNLEKKSDIDYTEVIKLLKYLDSTTFPGASITGATVADNTVTISAKADNKEASAQLLSKIRKAGIIQSPSITSYVDKNGIRFSIVGNVKLTDEKETVQGAASQDATTTAQ